jgi:hypothetical protein
MRRLAGGGAGFPRASLSSGAVFNGWMDSSSADAATGGSMEKERFAPNSFFWVSATIRYAWVSALFLYEPAEQPTSNRLSSTATKDRGHIRPTSPDIWS